MKVSDYKKAAFALSSGYVKSLYIMSAILMVLCTILPAILIIEKDSNIELPLLAVMGYTLGQMCASAMCPIFEGTKKRKNMLSLNELRNATVFYQLPADRKTMVRAYISFERFFSTMFFMGYILQGTALIFSPIKLSDMILTFAAQFIIFAAVIMISIFLGTGRQKKAELVRTAIYMAVIITQFFIKILMKETDTAEISAVSTALGASVIILGILGIIFMNLIYKGMAAACTNYSVSGEPITDERNDADV